MQRAGKQDDKQRPSKAPPAVHIPESIVGVERDGGSVLVAPAALKPRRTWKAKKSSRGSSKASAGPLMQSKTRHKAKEHQDELFEDEEVVIVMDEDEDKGDVQAVAWSVYSRSALLCARQLMIEAESRRPHAEDRSATASTCSTDEPRDDVQESPEQSMLASKPLFVMGMEALEDVLARCIRPPPVKRVMNANASEFKPACEIASKRSLNAAAAEFVPMRSVRVKVSPLNPSAPVFKPISQRRTRSPPRFEPPRPTLAKVSQSGQNPPKVQQPPPYAAQAAAAALLTLTKEPLEEPVEYPETIEPKPSRRLSRCVLLAAAALCAAGGVANAVRRRAL